MSRVDAAVEATTPTVVIRTTGEGQGSPGPVVRVRNLSIGSHRADSPAVAVPDGLSFDVHDGEILVIVGRRGCGQSTLLRVIAGQDVPDSGTVEVDGDRPVMGFVSGGDPLPVDLTVLDAVETALRADARVTPDRAAIRERARDALDRLDSTSLADRWPHQLSSGQRLRVQLARALAAGAGILLLDEPLADVDPRWRRDLRTELWAIQRALGLTTVIATHDHAEAMQLADRLAVLHQGRIVQLGRPRDIYREPASRVAATLTGTVNELPGRLTASEPAGVLTAVGEVTGQSGASALPPGEPVVAVWRPEQTRLERERPAGPNSWPVTVEASLYLGAHTQHVVTVDGFRFLIWQGETGGAGEEGWFPREGDRAWVHVDPDDVRVVPAD